MDITADLIKASILTEDDFGHEMRVRKVLESVPGAEVTHGWTYRDPQEGKPRQFDLRFTLRHEKYGRCIQLAVECKNLSPDAPLIVSGTDRVASESFHDYIKSETRIGLAFGQTAFTPSNSIQRCEGASSVYKPGAFVGKSLLRLKPDAKESNLVRAAAQESEIYGRWSQSLASADELCKRAPNFGFGQSKVAAVTTVTLPFVVVPDGTLWKCHYESTGKIRGAPIPADEVFFFINHLVEVRLLPMEQGRVALSHVHFVTLKGLRLFIQGLMSSVPGRWEEWFYGTRATG